MSIRSFFYLVISFSLINGCAYAPGQLMDAERISSDDTAESNQVELIPITPKTLAINESYTQEIKIPEQILSYQPESYKIGASDVLFITVWDHPEMTVPSGAPVQGPANGRTVRPDGTLFYPYIGTIKAEGLTIEQLRDVIASKLAKYIDNPQVDINIIDFVSQQVLLSGAFLQAKPIPITTKPLTLVEVMGVGGINTSNSDLSKLTIIRDGKEYILNFLALNRQPSDINKIYLKHGDRINLPYNDTRKVYVMGEVNNPQALKFQSDSMTLTDAIGSVGGLSQVTSKSNDVYVIRGVANLEKEKAKIYQLKAKSPSAFILATKFELQPQDVIYVGASGVTRWNRLISQLIPSLSVLNVSTNTVENIKDLNN